MRNCIRYERKQFTYVIYVCSVYCLVHTDVAVDVAVASLMETIAYSGRRHRLYPMLSPGARSCLLKLYLPLPQVRISQDCNVIIDMGLPYATSHIV